MTMQAVPLRMPFALALLLTLGTAQAQMEERTTAVVLDMATLATDLQPAEFVQAMHLDQVQLVDVRTAAERDQGYVEGSLHLDWTAHDFAERFAMLDPTRPVLLYCRSGGRSAQALAYLQERGFPQVHHLVGGMLAWEKGGLPVAR